MLLTRATIKLSVIAISCLIFFPITGCSNKTNTPTISTTDWLIEPGIGIGTIKFGTTLDEVSTHFGSPSQSSSSIYEYPELGIAFIATRSGELAALMIGCSTCDTSNTMIANCPFMTNNEIRLLASEDDIKAAYGSPDKRTETGDLTTLLYTSKNMKFTLNKNRQLVHMEFKKGT